MSTTGERNRREVEQRIRTDEIESREFERSDAAKAIIGFLTTAAIATATRVITLIAASDTVTDAFVWLGQNYGYWLTIFASSLSGGAFAVAWTKRRKKR